MCSNQISIANFTNLESVSYPVIKITGNIAIGSCQTNESQNVLLYKNDDVAPIITKLLNNHFKFFVELHEGGNNLKIQYCTDILEISVDYNPSKSDYAVIPLYVICDGHDGRFQAPKNEDNSVESACRRITLCAKLLQCIVAEKIFENSCGRKTFCLGDECKVFRSNLNHLEARMMKQEQLWKVIGREIMTSPIGSESKKFLAFLSSTNYCGEDYKSDMKSHEDLIGITQGYVALGGGGLALFGTACLYTWPELFEDIIPRFQDSTSVDKRNFLDDSCYRGTRGDCFSTTLGSVLHELLHTFDLGHTANGIMGRGFDNIHKIFVDTKSDSSNQSVDSSTTFHDEIHFQEELESESLSERLIAANKRKGFTVIKKLEDIGDTVLEKSCAVLLCYHSWFLEPPPNQNSSLTFDNVVKVIKSTAGIRVIEIRSLDKEMVLHSWVFTGRVLKFSFQIPEDTINLRKNQTLLMVVEDSVGKLLKEKILFQ